MNKTIRHLSKPVMVSATMVTTAVADAVTAPVESAAGMDSQGQSIRTFGCFDHPEEETYQKDPMQDSGVMVSLHDAKSPTHSTYVVQVDTTEEVFGSDCISVEVNEELKNCESEDSAIIDGDDSMPPLMMYSTVEIDDDLCSVNSTLTSGSMIEGESWIAPLMYDSSVREGMETLRMYPPTEAEADSAIEVLFQSKGLGLSPSLMTQDFFLELREVIMNPKSVEDVARHVNSRNGTSYMLASTSSFSTAYESPVVDEKVLSWESLTTKYNCGLCNSVLAAPHLLTCSHSFCFYCIHSHQQSQSGDAATFCPSCSGDLCQKSHEPLLDQDIRAAVTALETSKHQITEAEKIDIDSWRQRCAQFDEYAENKSRAEKADNDALNNEREIPYVEASRIADVRPETSGQNGAQKTWFSWLPDSCRNVLLTTLALAGILLVSMFRGRR